MYKHLALKTVSAVLFLFMLSWQASAQKSPTSEEAMAAAIRCCDLTAVTAARPRAAAVAIAGAAEIARAEARAAVGAKMKSKE